MIARKESWPFLPEVRLFHGKKKCRRFLRNRLRLNPKFMGDDLAQTWYRNGIAVVYMGHRSDDWYSESSLLVHEAYHVVVRHFRYLGEEEPNEEFVAYGVQAVSSSLNGAHEKWRRNKANQE